ncbi:hypothetical protein [Oenococcus sicerae]|uniref:hypothetical protein n=1 Tax=Oenococcus sicerae TaxID=2203724 RepID=UPI0039E83AA4
MSTKIERFANVSLISRQPSQLKKYLEEQDFIVKEDADSDQHLEVQVASDNIIPLIRQLDQAGLNFSDPKIVINSFRRAISKDL